MGIRFWCPNGHKLHVKEFQAGRVGVCPHCGTKFVIPHKSTRPSSKEVAAQTLETAPAGTTEDVLPLGGPPGASPPVAAPATVPTAIPVAAPVAPRAAAQVPVGQPVPTAVPAASVYTPQAAPIAGGIGAYGAAYPAAGAPAAPAGPPPAASAPADPISDSPDAVWYVRPPSGGQFGPATGDVMRAWLGEGRVSADTLVWREGWRDWQEAATVFPNLGANQELIPGVKPVSPTARAVGGGHAAGGDRLKARRKAKNLQIVVMVLLALAVVVLAGVFVWVLNQAPPTPAPSDTEPPAASAPAATPTAPAP